MCNYTTCNGLYFDDGDACTGHGTCDAPNTCTCEEGYSGSACEFHSCFGVVSYEQSVCSGHGSCDAINNCSCLTDFSGLDCSVDNSTGSTAWMYAVIIVPILCATALSVLIALCCFICCCLCVITLMRRRRRPRIQPNLEPLGKLDDIKDLTEDTQSEISYMGVYKKNPRSNASLDDEFAEDEFSSNDGGLYNSSFNWTRSQKNRIHPAASLSLHGGSESSESDVDISDQTVRNLVELFKKKEGG